jgi:hypothetical protein
VKRETFRLAANEKAFWNAAVHRSDTRRVVLCRNCRRRGAT